MPVKIHGRDYVTVAERIDLFREKYPDYSITTEIVSDTGDEVVMRASINHGQTIVSQGTAAEIRGAGNINKTSHYENCETSAVGRALAFLGLAGNEIASADEVANAIHQAPQIDRMESQAASVAARDPGTFIMPNGKYRGETVEYIAGIDPGYASWCIQQHSNPNVVAAFRNYGEEIGIDNKDEPE